MDRYRRREELEAVHHVFNSLPGGISKVLQGIHFVTEYSPYFLGLHFYNDEEDDYEIRSHFVRESLQQHLPKSRRNPTIVLLGESAVNPEDILHELGHALEDRLDLMGFKDYVSMCSLTEYSRGNYSEAFATNFQGWLTPHLEKPKYGFITQEDLLKGDSRAFHFFEKLNREFR